MKALRLLVPATLAAALVPIASGPASAAPPSNDVPGGATVITLGSEVTQDTSQATTDSDDATYNENCGAPATNASVWYTYTPSKSRNVAIDVSKSDYTAGVMVFEGTPSADSLISCGPDLAGAAVTAGTTYYIMAFSDSAVNGGTLDMSLKTAHSPRAHVALSKSGVAYHGGAARVHGTYKCTHDESFSQLAVHLKQRAGRLKIQGDAGARTICDGQRHSWSARVVSGNGYYAKGAAIGRAQLIVCGLIDCTLGGAKKHVSLAWAKHPDHRAMIPTTVARRAMHPLTSSAHRWPSHWNGR